MKIIGAGPTGCTAARVLAEAGHAVTLYEKKDHIGGAIFDVRDPQGYYVHVYGPHIFHTSNEDVWAFVRRFVFIICPILSGLLRIILADVTLAQIVAFWVPFYLIYNIGLRHMSGSTTSALWSSIVDTSSSPI